jgi:RND family efflux transporter MFP subunit
VDIADLRKLKATVKIPEVKIFVVKPGMDVIMKFDALEGREFRGKVTRIDPYVDPATRTSSVEMEIDNAAVGNLLRPGMFGQASIVERVFTGAVLVPESAVQSGSEGQYVFFENDGAARMQKIKTGARQGGFLQVTEGIASGDRVITFGGSNLSDGDKVIVQ